MGEAIIARRGGGNNIKSIQRGTLTTSTTTQNIAITAVDLNSAVLIITGVEGSGSDAGYSVSAKLTSPTNIEFKCAYYAGATVSWQVVEFNNVKSLQRGTSTLKSSGTDIAIAEINLSKSILVTNFRSSGTGAGYTGYSYHAKLTTNTNINARSTTSNGHLEWQVVEFK